MVTIKTEVVWQILFSFTICINKALLYSLRALGYKTIVTIVTELILSMSNRNTHRNSLKSIVTIVTK